LRNVAAIFGGAAKKFLCKEQASQQAVLPWLGGRNNKELLNADIDRFLWGDCRSADGIASPVAKSDCSVLSQEQCDGATELHLSDDGAMRAGQERQCLGAVHPKFAGWHDRLRRGAAHADVSSTHAVPEPQSIISACSVRRRLARAD